jgi:hypothetical protein
MKTRVRVIFYVHAFIAAYCLLCGLPDAYGHFHAWLIPNALTFYILLASSFVLPVVAAVAVVGAQCKHPVVLVPTHIVIGAAQFFVGLMPLVS